MLKIEKLAINPGLHLQKDDAITNGSVEFKINATAGDNRKGVFNITHAGTGEMAEISVATDYAADKTGINVADVKVTLVGRIKRTVKKGEKTIDLTDTLATATSGSPLAAAANVRVIDPATNAAVTVDNSTGPIKSIASGIVEFLNNATADKEYLIELQFATGAASDPDTAHQVKFAGGNCHVHILSRLKDDVADSHMHNVTSFTVTKQNKAAVDL